jgi:hypothetical protein
MILRPKDANTENEQVNSNPKNNPPVSFTSTTTPTPETRKRPVLSPAEYARKQEQPALDAAVAEIAAHDPRPLCSGCGMKHWEPSPDCKLGKKEQSAEAKPVVGK